MFLNGPFAMSLGRTNFNATISYDSLFCFQGSDTRKFFGSSSNEPYMWVFMIKIDNEGLRQPPNGNYLTGEPIYFISGGSQGNLGGSVDDGASRRIPSTVGSWTFNLQPIPISIADQELTAIPGVVICAAVLFEENLTQARAVEAAHQSTIELIKTTVRDIFASLGLAGLAADTAIDVFDSNPSLDLSSLTSDGIAALFQASALRIINRRLQPILDLFELALTGNALVTILKQSNFGGLVGSAIDHDEVLGSDVRIYTQPTLAATFNEFSNIPQANGRLTITSHLWNMPKWAFTLHGEAFAHRNFVDKPRSPLPPDHRLRVLYTQKRGTAYQTRVVGIAGDTWLLYRGEAAAMIQNGTREFYVDVAGRPPVDLYAQQGGFYNGVPWYYVETSPDGFAANNLLNLPEAPLELQWGTLEVWY